MGIKVRNLDIWIAPGPVNAMAQVRLPVRTALAVAKLSNRLADLRKPIETVRVSLVDQFAEKDENGKSVKNEQGNVKLADVEGFTRAFNELMEATCDSEIMAEKIRLPVTIAGICDKCHHNMDRAFEIESAILAPLEPFIEV